MVELKPCPFCGGKADLRQEDFDPVGCQHEAILIAVVVRRIM